MADVPRSAGDKVVDADYSVPFGYQCVAKVRAEKSGRAGH
jgi:hypothetical protein